MLDLGKIVYLDNFKTGSSYVIDFLLKCTNQKLIRYIEHEIALASALGDPFYFTTIRNPFDLYVSRFRYGCDHKDGIYLRFRQLNLGHLYQPTNECFNLWMQALLDPKLAHHLNDGYDIVAKHGIGLMSYLHFIYSIKHPNDRFLKLSSAEEFERIYEEEKVVSLVLRNEDLDAELRDFATNRFPELFDQELVEHYFSRQKKVNTSQAGEATKFELSPELRAIYLEREQFLFRRFYPELQERQDTL